jgi:hypothetical protein
MTSTEAVDFPRLPNARQLGLQMAGAFLIAGVVTVLVVLPAEYRVDPTGFGALTGLSELSAPQEIVVPTALSAPPEITKSQSSPFRSDTVNIHIGGLEDNYGQMEYKITMKPGDTMVYSWTASHAVDYEFHGHTLASAEKPDIEVMNYEANEASAANGSFTAPLDGIHGWYFLNRDLQTPVDIELKLSGYYALEPGVLK